jgi:hypothetical protein
LKLRITPGSVTHNVTGYKMPNVGVQRPPKAVRGNEGLVRTRHTTSNNIRIHAGFDAEARIAGMESSMMPLCMYCCVASRAAVRIA